MSWVRDTELGDLQRAARALLAHGVLTPSVCDEATWRSARRYSDELDTAFEGLAGYRVTRGTRIVRLVRRRDRLRVRPVFFTPGGQPFDRVRLALLALALAVLERSGSQTTLTDLARGVRRAGERLVALPFDPDEHASRLALSHVVRELERRGALRLTDGSPEAWEQGLEDAEALYDVDHEVCRALFPLGRGLVATGGLGGARRDGSAETGRDEVRRQRRQGLVRRLLEEPVVYRADLDDADRAFLHKEAGSLVRQLEALTGATLERRREGLALIDPGRRLSDRPFPGSGGPQQAALLLAGALASRVDTLPWEPAPHADERAQALLQAIDTAAPAEVLAETAAARPLTRSPQPFASDALLRELASALQASVGEALARAEHRQDATIFLRDGIEVLVAFDLVREVPGGVALMPALGRFREVQVQAAPEIQAQLGLFGGRSASLGGEGD